MLQRSITPNSILSSLNRFPNPSISPNLPARGARRARQVSGGSCICPADRHASRPITSKAVTNLTDALQNADSVRDQIRRWRLPPPEDKARTGDRTREMGRDACLVSWAICRTRR